MSRVGRITAYLSATVVMLLSATVASAQYAVSGSAPLNYKWRMSKEPFGKIVYPSFLENSARKVSFYIDAIDTTSLFGMSKTVRPVPVVLYPGNLYSNGMVSWAPKRMELITAPPTESYALSWLKQLSAHEYRHVVQISNMDVGFTRALHMILGQQAVGLVTAIPPGWFFEGDATVSETDHAMFGRGRQPSFSMGYRALLAESNRKLTYDRLKLGSYKYYYPDKYELGYYMIQSGRRYYGFDVWAKMNDYFGRYSFYVINGLFAFRKFAGADAGKISDRVFDDLRDFWSEASSVDDSSVAIKTHDRDEFTVFSHPSDVGDKILALKSDFSSPSRFVLVDPSNGNIDKLPFAATVSSRPVTDGQRVVWSEYKPSLFWEQSNNSVVRTARLDLSSSRPRLRKIKNISGRGSFFFPTPLDSGRMAVIEYDRENAPSLVVGDSLLKERTEWSLGSNSTSVTGMAWDDKSSTLAAIVLDSSGMWIGRFDWNKGAFEHITPSSYVTVSNLTAGGGKLYFSSIASGKDEVHCIDLSDGSEHRITTSKYGSTDQAVPVGDTITIVKYGIEGYSLARQSLDDAERDTVTHTVMPLSYLDPYPEDMGLVKLDTVNLSPSYSLTKERRFRRGASLFNVHSWMPVVIDVNRFMSERNVDRIGLGANIVMQDILGASSGSLGYGWDIFSQRNIFSGSFSHTGLPVHFGVSLDYGGEDQISYLDTADGYSKPLKSMLEAIVTASMPMSFSNGRNVKVLTPSVSYSYNNALIRETPADDVTTGVHKLGMALSWSSYRYMSKRDLAPRLGYSVTLNSTINPFNRDFGTLFDISACGWLPGVAKNHSLTINGEYQWQRLDRRCFIQQTYFPRGCILNVVPKNMVCSGASYKFPLAYPDGGIPAVIYFKRIALDLFGEYAHVKPAETFRKPVNFYTYGCEVSFTYNLLRFGADISTGISVYKPSDNAKPMVGFSLGFSI